MKFDRIRDALIEELCDAGELIRRGGDLFEDMGGHVVHESQLDRYIDDYMVNLSEEDRNELVERTRSEGSPNDDNDQAYQSAVDCEEEDKV